MIVGRGVLNWHRYERTTDRYGSIHLCRIVADEHSESKAEEYLVFPEELDGQHGRLYAVVVETRESYHRGDMARGLFPSTPSVGETIELGCGTVFVGKCLDGRFPEAEDYPICTIGLRPDDGRSRDWLNPEALYRLHHQTVDLYFEPTA